MFQSFIRRPVGTSVVRSHKPQVARIQSKLENL